MFEIRVICTPSDTDPVVAALDRTFKTGIIAVHPSADGTRNRLYMTAEHLAGAPVDEPWPTPEEAYALAPSTISEIGWTADQVARKPLGKGMPREFWLRKAATLDRIALADEGHGWTDADSADIATEAARRLMEEDGAAVICDPRRYVRQQYAQWAKNQHHR